MNRDPASGFRVVGVISAFGILCLVGAIWFVRNRQPSAGPGAPVVEVGREPRKQPARRLEITTSRPNIPVLVLPSRSDISMAGAGTTSGLPNMEVCLMDAETRMPIIAGRISFSEGNSRQVLGSFELGGQSCAGFQIDPGKYLLRAGGDGYLEVEQSITIDSKGDSKRQVFSLIRHVLVHGIVKNSAGRPQSGAWVSLFQESSHVTVRSNADGRFEAELLNPEVQKAYASLPPHPITALGPVVISDTRNPNLEITLPEAAPTVKISGTVSDDLGHPVDGAEVSLIPSTTYHVPDWRHDATLQGLQQVSAKSDARGRYSLEALPQNEALLTVAGARGCEVAGESLVLKETTVRDIRLKCHPTFRVRVEKEDGSTVPNAIIVGESSDHEPAILQTPEAGLYYALAYPFRIFAWTRWANQDGYGVTTSEWIKSYRDPIRLFLGRARVDGTVRDASGEPVRNFSVRLSTADNASRNLTFPFASEDGSFSLKYLPPGTAILEVMAEVSGPDGARTPASFSQEVILAEGQPVFLLAVLKPAETSLAQRSRPPE